MYDIEILKPSGYCMGVKRALKICERAMKSTDIARPIHVLGNIIHNKEIVKKLSDDGLITHNTPGKTRMELLDEIESGTVIFSAHGVSDSVKNKAKIKGLAYIDATCIDVLKVHNFIKEKLKNGYSVIYIGIRSHAEAEGVINLDSRINFISSLEDIKKLNIDNEKIVITNQTTLSLIDIKEFVDSIKEKYPNATFNNDICNATTSRQLAVIEQRKADLTLVVGDKLSSNTNKLYELSKTKNASYLVETVLDVKKIDLTNVKSINITSGASTPKYLVNEIITYLS